MQGLPEPLNAPSAVVTMREGDQIYVADSGNGRIGASFREIPAESRDRVVELAAKLGAVGLGGFMEIGRGGQALFDIPVSEGRAGAGSLA